MQTEFAHVVEVITAYVDAVSNSSRDDVLTVLQKFKAARTGKTKELLTAVENALENVKLDLVESQSGVNEVLLDVVSFLSYARTTTTLERHTSKLDELLERLDFVASGGVDAEVPRDTQTNVTSQAEAYIPKLPVKQPKNFEDPSLARHVERLTSLNAILTQIVDVSEHSRRDRQLRLEQLNLVNYVLLDATHKLAVDFKSFANKLVQEIRDSLEEKTNKSVTFVHFEVDDGIMYRSLSEVFRGKLREAVEVIGEGLLSHRDTQIQLRFSTSSSSNTIDITFMGFVDALDLIEHRMAELSGYESDNLIQYPLTDDKEQLRRTTKTRKERIALTLADLRQFVDSARGQFQMSSDNDGQFQIFVELPLYTRIVHTLPIEVGTDTFLLESHCVTAVLDTPKAQWDVTRTNIEYDDQSYRYCLIADHIKPNAPTADTQTWMMLLDVMSHKLALEVQHIGKPELQVSTPSLSKINHGHKFIGGRLLRLLLDPSTLIPTEMNKNDVHPQIETKTNILCLNTSQLLVKKVQRCIGTADLLLRYASTTADAIAEVQEYLPRILIIEDDPDDFRASDAVSRIAQAIPWANFTLLLFKDSDGTAVERIDRLPFKVICLTRNTDFAQLKKALAAAQDSAESA